MNLPLRGTTAAVKRRWQYVGHLKS